MEEVGRKLLRLIDVDDSFLDRLTKQQLFLILNNASDAPRISIQKGARVPQAFLRHIRSMLHAAFEENYVHDNKEIGLSLADVISYGLAFRTGLRVYPQWSHVVLGDEVQTIQNAHEALIRSGIFESGLQDQVRSLITFSLLAISQVQFRLYGYVGGYDLLPSGSIVLTITLTSSVPECISFQHFGKRRKAYQFCMGALDMHEMLPATINYRDIVPLCDEQDDRKLSIYIQQHAILRLKERLRFVHPTERMMLLYSSLMLTQQVVRGPDDQPLFVAHINKGEVYGYFSFVTQKDKLFVLTFLPVTSALTPEGKKLQKILHLSTKDITYLGMDCLDFLFHIDLDQIPILKNALIEAGIYRMKAIYNRYFSANIQPDEKKTAFVKKYLEDHPLNAAEEPAPANDDDSPQFILIHPPK
jgi:hypothetical protein